MIKERYHVAAWELVLSKYVLKNIRVKANLLSPSLHIDYKNTSYQTTDYTDTFLHCTSSDVSGTIQQVLHNTLEINSINDKIICKFYTKWVFQKAYFNNYENSHQVEKFMEISVWYLKNPVFAHTMNQRHIINGNWVIILKFYIVCIFVIVRDYTNMKLWSNLSISKYHIPTSRLKESRKRQEAFITSLEAVTISVQITFASICR